MWRIGLLCWRGQWTNTESSIGWREEQREKEIRQYFCSGSMRKLSKVWILIPWERHLFMRGRQIIRVRVRSSSWRLSWRKENLWELLILAEFKIIHEKGSKDHRQRWGQREQTKGWIEGWGDFWLNFSNLFWLALLKIVRRSRLLFSLQLPPFYSFWFIGQYKVRFVENMFENSMDNVFGWVYFHDA